MGLLGLSWAPGCHLGVPPTAVSEVVVGSVGAASAEPALADALGRGVGAALANRGALVARRGSDTAVVDIEVINSGSAAVAVDGDGAQVHEARLSVRFTWRAAAPSDVAGFREAPIPTRLLVLSGAERYTIAATVSGVPTTLAEGDPVTLSAAELRAAAMERLALRLADDAVVWFLYAPTESP